MWLAACRGASPKGSFPGVDFETTSGWQTGLRAGKSLFMAKTTTTSRIFQKWRTQSTHECRRRYEIALALNFLSPFLVEISTGLLIDGLA